MLDESPAGRREPVTNLVDAVEDHDHMRGWIGGALDPTEFDLALANARLQALR
ncbi:MAG TPA: hypothetical protein VM142_15195 [Acidimicrobiales bacterium]|nr:hypothetical protein [Acidimicrobiales bacterium]